MEITVSPSARRMPRTPVRNRDRRTPGPLPWRSADCSARSAVVSRISLTPALQVPTPTIWSPSSSFMAILPLRRTSTKSESLLRRTPPERVANITSYWSQGASSSGNGRIEVMLSPGSIGRMLTQALPREVGVPTGRRQTFSL